MDVAFLIINGHDKMLQNVVPQDTFCFLAATLSNDPGCHSNSHRPPIVLSASGAKSFLCIQARRLLQEYLPTECSISIVSRDIFALACGRYWSYFELKPRADFQMLCTRP